jgi:cell division protein FtsW (lipid II flippase)
VSVPLRLDRPLLAFAVASLAAVALGAAVCAMSGAAQVLWMQNLAAWALGFAAAAALARWSGDAVIRLAVLAAPLALAATLFNPGLEGVHRWLAAGPVRLNAAMLLLPSFVVALAALAGRVRWWWIPAFVALGALTLQPDASQATALALALCALAAGLRSERPAWRWILAVAALALAAFSWTRPDPLAPVAEVEGIIQLAASHSPLLGAAGVIVLILVAALPALTTLGRDQGETGAGIALTVLLLAWIAAPVVGAFPVPLVGIGVSPILGAWLGMGLLTSLTRRRSRQR